MTEGKGFRIRKVVDYSKFIENDSDSDDFALPNPKKSKSSNSASSDEKNRSNSKGDCVVVVKKPPLQVTDRNDCAKLSPVPDAKTKLEPSLSNSKQRQVVVGSNEANSGSGHSDYSDDEKPAHRDATLKKIKQANDQPSKSATVITKRTETTSKAAKDGSRANKSNENPTKVHSNSVQESEKCSRVKWKPPASSKSASAMGKTKDSLSPASSGLRLGLSRNARTKPLHSNVKL